jgi:hypothetical protein
MKTVPESMEVIFLWVKLISEVHKGAGFAVQEEDVVRCD